MPSDTAIPVSVPNLSGNEWTYVKECLDSHWISGIGPFVKRFEHLLAQSVGAPFAVAVVNGTAALHVALLAVGLQPEEEVLVPTLTFIASANAVRYCGAWPVFVDVERATWQMDVGKVASFLEAECAWRNGGLWNRASGRRVRLIMVVHALGHPADIAALGELAERYGLDVVEDASESLGALYRGRPIGSHGRIACFSFNGNKIVTSGGGGMVVTQDEAIARRIRYLITQARDDDAEDLHHEIGFNYRLSDLQAAIGIAQLERLPDFVAAKRSIAAFYRSRLGDVGGLELPTEAPWARSTFWLYTVLVDPGAFGMDRRELRRHLVASGIEGRPLWVPVHLQRPYRQCQAYRIEVADHLYERALSLPCSTGISSGELERVGDAVKSIAR